MATRWILGLLTALLAIGGQTAEAQAPVTVGIVPFDGRAATVAEQLVARALRTDHTVLGADDVRELAEHQNIALDGSLQASAALARAGGLNLLVRGEVTGRRRPNLRLVVTDADGDELARQTLRLGRGRRSARRIRRRLRALVAEAIEVWRQRPTSPASEAPPAAAEPATTVPAVPRTSDDDSARATYLTLTAGVSLRTRDASIELEDGTARRYASGAYPAAAISAELRPMAGEEHLGRGLFIGAMFGHSLGLSSQSPDDASEIGTNFVRVAADVGWLLAIDPSLELGVAFGARYDGYLLGPNPVLPSAEYLSLRPAARARVRLWDETIVFEAELGYRGVLTLGTLGSTFAQQSGGHGLDLGAQLGGHLLGPASLGLCWALRVEYVSYWLSFGGAATTGPTATSGREEAVRLTGSVGWAF